MLEFMHSLGHEEWHNYVSALTHPELGAKLDSKTLEAVANITHAAEEAQWTQPEMEEMVKSIASGIASPAHASMFTFRSEFYTPDAFGRQECLADMYGLLAIGAMSDKSNSRSYQSVADLLKFSNDDFRNVAKDIFKNIGTVWSAVTDWLKRSGWSPKQVQTLYDVVDNMKGMMKSAAWAEHQTELFLRHNRDT